ncbi:MAG: hypothetical protein KDB27_36130 [Planctomycetales bacterium]|nr:hypothetical protein [Planctomycetales bacterium]
MAIVLLFFVIALSLAITKVAATGANPGTEPSAEWDYWFEAKHLSTQ